MPGTKSYRPWSPDQPFLMPPNPGEWLPEDHLARFVLELIRELDITAIEAPIQSKDPRGERPYDPRMMMGLLVYGYCTGVMSSRKIERKTYEDVAFRYLAGGQHPEFSTICTFRRTHLAAVKDLFRQVVRLAREAGLIKMGHVSLDGSKVDANASKHKAMSYDRMLTDEQRLEAEIRDLLARAEDQDQADDARLGAGVPETDLPGELKRREDRLARIRAAKAALEADARATRAAQLREQAERARKAAAASDDPAEKGRAERRAERRDAAAAALTAADGDEPSGSRTASGAPGEPGPSNDAGPSTTSAASSGGTADDVQAGELPVHHAKVTRDGAPQASAQRNFTDPDSRIMERGGGFTQAYNGHIAVDDEWHVIVGQGASNQAPDTEYFIPMLERVQATVGLLPEKATADAGFWSPENARWAEEHAVDAYISTQRHRHGAPATDPAEPPGPTATPQQRMRHKVSTPEGRAIYRRRKCLPEPVFGQIKQAMGFRRFSMRGLEKARGEWGLVCMCHNVRRLHAARVTGRTAS
jgi:transposase